MVNTEYLIDYSKIEFKPIGPLIHTYYVPNLSKVLSNYEEILLKEFEDGKTVREKTGYANNKIENKYLKNNLLGLNEYIAERFYDTGKKISDGDISVYVQDNKNFVSDPHNHYLGSMISTLYINPPKEGNGGELELILPPHPNFKLVPKEDYVYFFPSWLIHRPLEQKINTSRICINFACYYEKKIKHKITQDQW